VPSIKWTFIRLRTVFSGSDVSRSGRRFRKSNQGDGESGGPASGLPTRGAAIGDPAVPRAALRCAVGVIESVLFNR